jgi:hypothetical protein
LERKNDPPFSHLAPVFDSVWMSRLFTLTRPCSGGVF